MKVQVIEFAASARNGLSYGNPHIVFDAVPNLGRVTEYCTGMIEVPASRAEKVMTLLADAGFAPKLASGVIRCGSHGAYHVADATPEKTFRRVK